MPAVQRDQIRSEQGDVKRAHHAPAVGKFGLLELLSASGGLM
jgi:hypothetical protein